MSFRTIMVYLDSEESAPSLLQAATELARQHTAHLIGLYVVPPLNVYVYSEFPIPVELNENHFAQHEILSSKLRKQFDTATENQNFVAEWRNVAATPLTVSDTIAELANTVDLLIVSQGTADSKGSKTREIPEQVLMAANRPVILVPSTNASSTIGKNIYIFWNGGPEATRAVFDSLPALKLAEAVTVHRINPGQFDRHHVLGTPDELVSTLARHDVKVTLTESDAKRGEVGHELLRYADDNGADLIVMGIYGHSRLRETLFGGATVTVLKEMHTPVLMSH